jgi:parvulin-like peptidyl-prolyl isomerase
MKHRIHLALLVVGAALVVSACATASDAAIVNGTVITDDDVTGIRTTPTGAVVAGDGFRSDLSTLIIVQATVDAAEEDFGVVLDTSETGQQAYLNQARPEIVNIVSSIEANPELTDSALDVVITQMMVSDAVQQAIVESDEFVEIVWETSRDDMMQVCLRHILVATEADADVVLGRVESGEDFDAVAADVSLDAATLPCPVSPTAFVVPFAQAATVAPIGVPVGPVETEFGFHVVIVDARQAPSSFEEFEADPGRWVPDGVIEGAWSTWRNEAVGRADISVRSQIGRWFPEGDGILPPPESP